jgi:23S rRNA (uridine2552-2'-O)-methyltransferase
VFLENIFRKGKPAVGSKKPGKQPDYYARLAKSKGYPARSVFKLEEIQQKYAIMKSGDTVLDIGAAPGSWSLFASRTVGKHGTVVAVDLKQLDDQVVQKVPNLELITGDIFSLDVEAAIGEHGPYDVVVSDAAPSTSGNKTADAGRSFTLVTRVLELCGTVLKPGGNLVVKLFQGGYEQELIQAARERFKKVKTYRPQATRKPSVEIYIIGWGKKE